MASNTASVTNSDIITTQNQQQAKAEIHEGLRKFIYYECANQMNTSGTVHLQ